MKKEQKKYMYEELPAFIVLKHDICFFAFMKYENSYICFPKIVDNYKGNDYHEWFKDVKTIISDYYNYLEGLHSNIYLVPEEDVDKIINPIEFTLNRKYKNYKFNYPYYIDELLKNISSFFDIASEDIAIEGSLLLNKYKESSDIDLIIYGIDNAKKIATKFNCFCSYGNIRSFSKKEATEYVTKRSESGYGSNINQQLKQFYRRYYGFIYDKQFSIVCVPKSNEFNYINLSRKLTYFSQFNGELEVVDDYYSKIIPSVYIGVCNGEKYRVEIYNHYSINQIKKGEKVHIEGNCFIDEKKEKIIILGFWYDVKERVDVL